MKIFRIFTLLGVLLPSLVSGPSAAAAPPPAPALLAPSNGASVTVPFTLSWSQVLDPAAQNGGYNWQVSSSSTFSTLAAADSTFPSVTQATVSGLANGTYFWRVDAVNGTIEASAWSATRSLTVTGAGPGQLAAPTLNPPHGGTTRFHPFEAIRFSWSAVPGAATYTTEFSTDPSFPVNSVNYYSVTNIPGTSDGTLHHESMPQGTWFMRVRGVDANRVNGATSNVISFSVLYGNPVGPPPTLISPTGNPTLTLPVTFSWTDGYNPQSSGYEFQVSTGSSFSTLVNPVPGLTNPRIVYTDLPAGQLFWRVRSHQGMASPTTTAVTAWSATGTFTVSSAAPVPASVTLTRDPLYSGAEQRLIVQLTGRAPSGGAVVGLTSSDPNALSVPTTVTIGAGVATGPELTLFAGQVTTPRSVTVTASYGGSSASTTITVMPPTLKPDPLQPEVRATGGARMTGRLDLAGGGLAPAGGVAVSLSSDSPAASVPATVTIPAGANSTAFTIQTSAVAATTPVTIRATHGGVTAQWQITLTPSPSPDSLTLRPVSTTNGSQGVVTIPASASAGHDQLVRVTSSNPGIAAVPEFVTVFAGSGVGYFDIVTTPVSAPTTVTISVSGGGVTLSSDLTVHPSLPTLTALSVSPTSVVGGSSATGTVTLSSAAPAGGVTVSLGSNLPGSASVPASVTVPPGATGASFTVTTFPVDNTTVQLSASLDGVFQFAALTVTRAPTSPSLSALAVSPSSVVGGASSTGTVTLSAAAPSGGTVVSLSDNSSAATVPASVTVASGATSRTFTVTTSAVSSSTPVTISGSSGGTTRSAALNVNPPTQAPTVPTLLSPANGATVAPPVTLDWSDVSAATSYRIQIDDSSSFSAPRVVDQTLSVSQFTAGSLPVRQHWWRVRGINSAGTAGAWSTVRRFTPQGAPPAPALSAIALSPTSVVGGASSQGTATLTSPAPSGGAVVTLSSSNAAVAAVPAGVTVAAGATSATFTVSTASVSAPTTPTISGTYGGVTRTATLTVTPPPAPAALSTVSVNPTSVTGGTASQGTVTLTSAAPSGGFAVSVSSNNAAANVPANVSVAQGATSATFAIATSGVGAPTPITITASAGGVARTATLTVNPPGQAATLTVTATGRSGERITSAPASINVSVGSTGSASFTTGTAITLSVSNGRDAVWSGACSSGGNKRRSCTFTLNGNATVTANVQ